MSRFLTQVHRATAADVPRVLMLLESALRQYLSFGREDLPYFLAQNKVWLADAADTLWGFVCITSRASSLADLRALALINGWRVDTGLQTLLTPAIGDLRVQGTTALVCLGSAAWLVPPLQRAGFRLVDRIVYLERPAATAWPPSEPRASLRPIGQADLDTLIALDHSAFTTLWHFDRGHFMELLVTSSRSVIAESAGQAVGYAISYVLGEIGFIVRLAVHPDYQGQGVGSQLLADALHHCRQAGAVTIRLNTQESNIASHRLYGHFGFQRTGRRVPVLVKEL
ncbi:MAG: GNAT family N-acetyltransferase [Anaerolineae bacterium]|nr:GNAT family N-acetyltransferase [Anaerolineae bacterium]